MPKREKGEREGRKRTEKEKGEIEQEGERGGREGREGRREGKGREEKGIPCPAFKRCPRYFSKPTPGHVACHFNPMNVTVLAFNICAVKAKCTTYSFTTPND